MFTFSRMASVALGLSITAVLTSSGQRLTSGEARTSVGDSSASPGPLAKGLSPDLKPVNIQVAMKKVADWQARRVERPPSQDWTFATLYMGFLSASKTLQDDQYRDSVLGVAQYYHWQLGPRKTHADDQAIGQAYLELFRENPEPGRIAPLRKQFDELMKLPDDPHKPVWWWCDALFMAPPVWAGLSRATGDPRYLDYMDREWRITSSLLWDPNEQLFSRDASYLNKTEHNGRKVFWSRGNGWVMGGIVAILEEMPANDPRRDFYIDKLQRMSAAIAAAQGKDGLWRAGLLDPDSYPNPEISGSSFFIYAMAWGVQHGYLDAAKFAPVVRRGWRGIIRHIYEDGRLGDIQPVGEAPGAYSPSSSYVFGVGAFLLAGSELNSWASESPAVEFSSSESPGMSKGKQ